MDMLEARADPAADGSDYAIDWRLVKLALIELYEVGYLGPFTVEDMFDRFPELRSA